MLNRFYRWLGRKITKANDTGVELSVECDDAQGMNGFSALNHNSRIRSTGMTFCVYRADGGYVVEYLYYDSKKDENYTGLHVVTEDQTLSAALEKIIVVESLRR